MTAITSRIDLTGRFFEKDPAKTIAGNVTAMLHEIAHELEGDVRQQLEQGESGRVPVRAIGADARVSRFVRGRVESLSGTPWHQWAVISPDRTGLSAPQAIALHAAGAKVEKQTGAFRRTTGKVRIAKTDLAKGLE